MVNYMACELYFNNAVLKEQKQNLHSAVKGIQLFPTKKEKMPLNILCGGCPDALLRTTLERPKDLFSWVLRVLTADGSQQKSLSGMPSVDDTAPLRLHLIPTTVHIP